MIIEGALAVKAAILGNKRPIYHVMIDKNKVSKDVDFIKRITKEKNIKLSFIDTEGIKDVVAGKTHGGIVAEVGFRKLEKANVQYFSRVLLVEGVEDPYNIGTIIRTAKAAGCDAILTNDRDWKDSEAIIIKSSAGASEALAWIRLSEFKTTLSKLKENGFKIVSAMRQDDAISLNQINLTGKICLCIGGEMRGLSKDVVLSSDQFVMITYPTNTKFALSAVSASAVLLFEMVRQEAMLDKQT